MSSPGTTSKQDTSADANEEQSYYSPLSKDDAYGILDGENTTNSGQSGSNPVNDSKATGQLQSSQVRWFYKDQSGNSLWTPLGGFDTLIAEDAYRKLPPDLKVPKKWEEKFEKSVPTDVEEKKTEPKVEAEYASPSLKVQVLGGLYELDLLKRKIFSVYWSGEVLECTRGTWFFGSWQPLDEVSADLIEKEHLRVFGGRKSSDFASAPKPIHTHVFPDFNVDWYSPTEVYFFSNRTPSQLVKSFTRKLGYFQKSAGTRVIRAYKTLATDGDKRKDISHLVFVVHGVGQIMNMNIGDRVFGNTCAIRERVTAMKEEFFPDSDQYVEFLPVEWRSKVVLDGGLVECVTPPNIRYLRNFINTSAMDVMYYMSPIYCWEIQDCVANEMNRLYSMYVERNPDFNPKVSVVAHSLGAVIVYDIVSGFLPQGFVRGESFVPGKSKLTFDLENIFCFGSPLSVFLAMREKKDYCDGNSFPPSLCKRLYNIYHITDPIAYRVEPLVHEGYCRVAPVPIQHYSCSNPKRYSEMPVMMMDDISTSATGTDDDLPGNFSAENAVYGRPGFLDEDPGNADDAGPGGLAVMPGPSSNNNDAAWRDKGRNIWNNLWKNQKNKVRNPPRPVDPAIEPLEHRLDYVLTSGSTGALVIRSVLVSHMAYWSDNDVAFFVLTRIFPELEEELCSEEKREAKKNRKRKNAAVSSPSVTKDPRATGLGQID